MPNNPQYIDISDIIESIYIAAEKHISKTGNTNPKLMSYLGIEQNRRLEEHFRQIGCVRDDRFLGEKKMFTGSVIVPVILADHLATYVVEE